MYVGTHLPRTEVGSYVGRCVGSQYYPERAKRTHFSPFFFIHSFFRFSFSLFMIHFLSCYRNLPMYPHSVHMFIPQCYDVYIVATPSFQSRQVRPTNYHIVDIHR